MEKAAEYASQHLHRAGRAYELGETGLTAAAGIAAFRRLRMRLPQGLAMITRPALRPAAERIEETRHGIEVPTFP